MDVLHSSPVPVSDMGNLNCMDNLDLGDQTEQIRKLAILGLPWDTSEDTLRSYFSQFGPLEHAEIMKDRYTGKSRGFGFVTFTDPATAQLALSAQHTIDGRRCEAKIALPKGEPSPPRTTRIFVARIPPSVSEAQFRSYFENFGKLQDAYMPKDHSKQGYRGIGFVTFASPDAVEKVMAVKHWLNGHEIAIDRATPKDEPATLAKNMFARLPLSAGARRSYDNGSGIVGPGLSSVMNLSPSLLSNITNGNVGAPFGNIRALSEDSNIAGLVSRAPEVRPPVLSMPTFDQSQPGSATSNASVRSQSMGLNFNSLNLNQSSAAAAAAAAATTAALQSLAKAQVMPEANMINTVNMSSINSIGMGMNNAVRMNSQGLSGMTPELSASLINTVNAMGTAAAMQQLMAAAAATNRRSFDSASAALKRLENPAIASARAGPRIFVGKLSKDTTETDVKEYFMKFGYVMDVYLPKAKENKLEHRGFGFVTFETEAAIQRVVSHGTHRLRGSTIAIDIAMPKVDDDNLGGLDGHLDNSPSYNTPLSLPLLTQAM